MIIKIYKLVEKKHFEYETGKGDHIKTETIREPGYEIEIKADELISLLFRLEKSGFITRGIRQE